MKRGFFISRKYFLFSVVVVWGFALFVTPVFAQESSSNWRSTYDTILMWINFLILAGVLYKFLKDPMKDFIKGRKRDMEKELETAEKQKKLADEKIGESVEMLEQGKARFEQMRVRIIEQGEKKKEQIIKEAEEQSNFMMIEAKRKIDSQIIRAKGEFREELIDRAFEMVMERIPKEITEEDEERFIERYISEAAT